MLIRLIGSMNFQDAFVYFLCTNSGTVIGHHLMSNVN